MRIFRVALAASLVLTLGACAGTNVPNDDKVQKAIPITPAMRTQIEIGVRGKLKDPESARFGEMMAGVTPSGKTAVCGYVNAKNSFGGYTGEKPFIGRLYPESFRLSAMGGTEIETSAVRQVCAAIGMPLLF